MSVTSAFEMAAVEPPLVPDNYQLKWHSFGSHLHSSVATLLKSEHFADVFLCSGEGHCFPAHRFVLSSCSQYFSGIFDRMKQTQQNLPMYVVLPPEISTRTLKTLIRYMYSGETTVSNDILDNVLRGGDALKIRGLWRQKNDGPFPMEAPAQQLAHTNKPSRLQEDIAKSQSNMNAVHSKTKQVPKLTIKSGKSFETIKNSLPQTKKNETTHVPIKITENHKSPATESPVSEKRPRLEPKKIETLLQKSQHDVNCDKNDKTREYLVIKDEPIDWEDYIESPVVQSDEFRTEITIKPEILYDPAEDADEADTTEETMESIEPVYSPLTCELCAEVFAYPADWVRHIEGHSSLDGQTDQPARRQRRGRKCDVRDIHAFHLIHKIILRRRIFVYIHG